MAVSTDDNEEKTTSNTTASRREKVMQPYEYLKSLPGKSIRSKLIDTFNEWIHTEESKVLVIKNVIEKLHNASLMIDDIEDGAIKRRGFSCAHLKFGLPITINSANLVYFDALRELNDAFKDPEIISIFSDECINLHMGQGLEIYYRDHGIKPSEEEYFYINSMKTGGLFRLATKLLIKSKNRNDSDCDCDHMTKILKLSNILGEYYQLLDDYKNIFGCEDLKLNDQKCEDFATDLAEGKFTLPTIRSSLNRLKVTEISERRLIVEKLRDEGSDLYCLERLRQLEEEMIKISDSIGQNESFLKIIYSLKKF